MDSRIDRHRHPATHPGALSDGGALPGGGAISDGGALPGGGAISGPVGIVSGARPDAPGAALRPAETEQDVAEQQTDLICRFRPDTTLTFVNDAYARHFGKTAEQLIGRSFLELIPAEQREAARSHVESLCASPRAVAYEHAAIAADGRLRWHQWIDHLVPEAPGRGMEFQSVGRDVTERHEAEAALQRSEQIARAQAAVITATLQSITREPTPDAFIGQVLRTIVEQLGGIAGTFWVPAETPGSVRVYLDLEHDRLVKAEDSDHPGRLPQRIVALEREPPAQLDDPRVFDFDHISHHPDYAPFRQWALRQGVRTVLQVPMVFGAEVVGLYTVRFDRERSFEPQDLQLAKALALQATLAIRLTQLAEQAKSVAVSQERVAQLAQANRALTGTLDRLATEPSLATALGHVLAAVTHQLEAHSCTLWLYDLVEGVAHLHMVYEHGRIVPAVGSEHPHAQRPIPLDKPTHQRNVLDSDLALTEVCVANGFLPEMCEYLHGQGIRHLLSVPMRLGAVVVGACFVRIYQDRMPGPERVELARVLTKQATLLLYASRMAELAQQAALGRERETAAQDRVRELAGVNATLQEALALLASEPGQDRFVAYLLQRVVEQFSAHSASLLLPDEPRKRIVLHLTCQDGRIYDREAYGESPIARAVEGNEDAARRWALFQDPYTPAVFAVEDAGFPDVLRRPLRAMGIRCVATAPLRLGERVIGRLVVRFASARSLSDSQIELLQSIASQMAVALRMSHLADEVRRAAVLDERNRMARDIHDTLAQGFTGVIVQLEAAKDAIARRRGRDTRAHIQRAADLARHSLAEARRSVRALKPLALEQGGLQTAFDVLLANVTAGTGLSAHFACSGEACALPLDVEESLLRIGQEALTNVLKHAKARRFEAALAFDPAAIALALRDDGVGFDPAARTEGVGLRGMHERAERLGGRLEVDSAPGRGTRILVRLPRPA